MTYSNWVVSGGGWYDKIANTLFDANLNIGEIWNATQHYYWHGLKYLSFVVA